MPVVEPGDRQVPADPELVPLFTLEAVTQGITTLTPGTVFNFEVWPADEMEDFQLSTYAAGNGNSNSTWQPVVPAARSRQAYRLPRSRDEWSNPDPPDPDHEMGEDL